MCLVLTDCLNDNPDSVDRKEEPEVDVLAEEDFLQRVQWVHPGVKQFMGIGSVECYLDIVSLGER